MIASVPIIDMIGTTPSDGLGCQTRVTERARAVFEAIPNRTKTRHTRTETDVFIIMVSIYNVEIISSRCAGF